MPRGGIGVDYDHLGKEEPRARFLQDKREILINLDHPQVAKTFEETSRRVVEPAFLRLSWEVAICEYAVGLARLRDEAGHYVAVEQPLFDIRETIDSLSRQILG